MGRYVQRTHPLEPLSMLALFTQLETTWLEALQSKDLSTIDELLDDAFVCTPWNSKSELLLRNEYLDEVKRTEFKSCHVTVLNVQALDTFAVVKCRLQCGYALGQTQWEADFIVTDVWVQKNRQWRVLNRHASVESEPAETAA